MLDNVSNIVEFPPVLCFLVFKNFCTSADVFIRLYPIFALFSDNSFANNISALAKTDFIASVPPFFKKFFKLAIVTASLKLPTILPSEELIKALSKF